MQPFCDPKLQNLKRLSLRANVLAYRLDFEDNGRSCLPHLHHLNLGMNPLFFDVAGYFPKNTPAAHSVLEQGIPVKYFWSLSNVRTVDVSGLYNQMYTFNYQFCKDCELDIESFFRQVPRIVQDVPDFPNFNVSSGFVKSQPTKNGTDLHGVQSLVTSLMVSPGTQVLLADTAINGLAWDLAVVKECPYIIYPVDTVVYINVSNNDVSMLDCPVLGIKSLKVLDASFCHLSSFNVDVLKRHYVPNIELLYVRGNNLNNTSDFPEAFSEAVHLRELDLSYNGLHSLPNNSFETLVNLEKLDLSNNVLTSVGLLLSKLTKLNILDLSSNMIPYLTAPFQKQLEAISRHNAKFRLLLDKNPFRCGCEAVQFLDWLKNTNVTIERLESVTCVNKKTLLLHVNTIKLAKDCVSSFFRYYVIIGTMGTFVLVVIATSITTYKKRWKIAWHIYTFKRKLCKNNYEILEETEVDRRYDAYVEYHRDDTIGLPWLKDTLIKFVEKQWGKKLFIFDRNSNACNSIIGETIYGIQQSKKIIFILTDTYLKKGYWEMVLYWAVRQGLNNIIMCCLGDMTIDKLPRSLAKVAIELQERYPAHYLEIPLQAACFSENDISNNLKLALEEPV